MARKPRIDVPGGLYHVITRGNNRQDLFRTDPDRSRYLEILADAQRKFDLQIYAYVLMPNHVHLLCEMTSGRLAKCMQVIQQRYAQYMNRRHRRVGHLYQGRYRAILCERDRYLVALTRYIHLNPVRAGLADDPAAYPWSSHGAYLEGTGSPLRVTTTAVLGTFSENPSRARRAYSQFINEGLDIGHARQYYAVVDQQLLGSNTFVERVAQSRGSKKARPSPGRLPLGELLERVARETHVPTSHMRGRNRSVSVYRARMLFCHVAVTSVCHPIKTVAEILGRDPSNITRAVARAEQMDARWRNTLARAVLGDK